MLTSVAVALLLAVATGDYTGLGQGFYLPSLSLIEDNGFGKSIFKDIPKECIRPVPSLINREEKTFFENTKAFYSKIGVESSLSGEVTDGFTLGASITAASNSIDSENLDVKGMSLDVYAITGFYDFLPDCMSRTDLDDEFVAAFENLEAEISDPSRPTSWYMYDAFFRTYGSHVTKRVSHGSKLTRYVFSKSSEKITTEQFLLKTCASLSIANLKYCSNFTMDDYKKVAHLATSEELTVRGGSADTRAKLMINVTDDLVEKFLKEANLTDQPVNQQFESIWDLLKTRYIGTPHFAKAINMEAYYLGFMNMGCGHQVVRGTELRRFVLVDDDPIVPGYECQLAPMGCRSNDDCHIGGGGARCFCYGPSCVDNHDSPDAHHSLQKDRYVKEQKDGTTTWEGVNWSCKYHAGIWCFCRPGWGGDWETVWPASKRMSELQKLRNTHRALA